MPRRIFFAHKLFSIGTLILFVLVIFSGSYYLFKYKKIATQGPEIQKNENPLTYLSNGDRASSYQKSKFYLTNDDLTSVETQPIKHEEFRLPSPSPSTLAN